MLEPWIIEEIKRREEERRRREQERRIEIPVERPPQEQTEKEEEKPWEPTEIDIGGGDDESESKRSRITEFDMRLI